MLAKWPVPHHVQDGIRGYVLRGFEKVSIPFLRKSADEKNVAPSRLENPGSDDRKLGFT